MASMDVFNSNAFSLTSLTSVVNLLDYNPSYLGEMNIFDSKPVQSQNIFVDRRDGFLTLIPSSPTGAPPDELTRDDRDAISLRTTRLTRGFSVYATEVQNVRAFNGETEFERVQVEFARRMERVRQDMEYTHENHRLAAIQGRLIDADGTTELYNYYNTFGETEAPAVPFNLATATTDVRGVCAEIIRSMARSARGSFTPQTKVHALVGDAFFDALVVHPQVRETYLNYQAAAALRDGSAFGDLDYGGIMFHNYRGSDDNSTVAVGANDAFFFPVGARDVFTKAMAPHESIEYANTPGLDMYLSLIHI